MEKTLTYINGNWKNFKVKLIKFEKKFDKKEQREFSFQFLYRQINVLFVDFFELIYRKKKQLKQHTFCGKG